MRTQFLKKVLKMLLRAKVFVHRVEALFLKDDQDAKRSQFAHIIHAVHGASGNAGDRFCQDHIDLSLAAEADHPHKLGKPGSVLQKALLRQHVADSFHPLLQTAAAACIIRASLLDTSSVVIIWILILVLD